MTVKDGIVFERERIVRFSDCDPAGIVFYPQYFVMLNGLNEDWFADGLGVSFKELHMVRQIGVPVVKLMSEFHAPSELGDHLSLRLFVERLGTRSFTLNMQCVGNNGPRVTVQEVLVCMSMEAHKSIDIPTDIRRAMEIFVGGGEGRLAS